MHPVKTRSKRKRTVLVVVLALGVGLPPPAQAYLLDFAAVSINPAILISYAGGYPSEPPPVERNPKVSDLGLAGDLGRQLSPAIPPSPKIFHSPAEPLVDYRSPVPSAATVWMLGARSLHGSKTPRSGISDLTMSGGATQLSGSLRTASLTGPTPEGRKSFFHLGGFDPTATKGLHRQSIDDIYDPGFAASFASAPGAATGALVPHRNIFNHLAPFSSMLLLLGCGLMGLVGLRYRRRRG